MTDVANQIADIKQKSDRIAGAQIRQVSGGYVVACNSQYRDRDTKTIVMSEQDEGVASTPEQAAQMALNYIKTNVFNSAV